MLWLTDPGSRVVDDVLALYRDAFTATRIPDARVRALLESGRYRLAVDRPATPRCFALVAVFPRAGFAHLDYIATSPASRGEGLATKLVEFLTTRIPGPPDGLDLLSLEVDTHLYRFYGERGALKMADVAYVFPGERPVPLALLAFPFAGQTELPASRVRTIVETLYTEVHGRTLDDPLLVPIVGHLPDPVRLVPPIAP